MIGVLGEDSVKQMLNNQINIVFICNVDSLGHIKKIKRIRSKQKVSDGFIAYMENYLISNKISFYICFENDPPGITKDQVIKHVREYFKDNNGKLIGFGFPGELMNLYEYEKGKARENGIFLSKYDYLLMQIDNILHLDTMRMGGENSGKYLNTGSELIRDLNKKGDGAKTVTISMGAAGSGNSESHYLANSTNGVGTDSNVSFDPTANPSIPTKDPATGNVSGATRPNEIGLGHELIHADRSMKGKAVDYSKWTMQTYKDANGKKITESVRKEEAETVGLQGNHKYNENKLRKEQGLNERGAY
jgi:hypothetical protein